MFSLLLKFKRWLKRLLKVQSESRQVAKRSFRSRTSKLIILLGASVVIGVLYPGEALYDPLDMPREGETSLQDVIAPFEIVVRKSDRELNEERELIKASLPLIIDLDTTVAKETIASLFEFAGLVDSLKSGVDELDQESVRELAAIVSQRFPLLAESAVVQSFAFDSLGPPVERLESVFFEVIYPVGVLPDHPVLPESRSRSVLIRRGETENLHLRERLLKPTAAGLQLLGALNRISVVDSIDVEYYYQIGRAFIRPNLTLNQAEYRLRLDRQLNSISRINEVIHASDIIIRSGSRVSERQERILNEMAMVLRSMAIDEGRLEALLPMAARVLLVFAAFATLYLFLYYFRREIFNSNPRLLALTLVFALQLVLIYIASENLSLSRYLLPVAVLPIVVTILFDAEVGLLATMALAMILGIMHRFDFSLVLMTMSVGVVACAASRQVCKRTDFLKIILLTSLSLAIFVPLVEHFKLSPTDELTTEIVYALVNGVICTFVTVGVLPFFESIFGITTDIRLLELSDLNHPLLKRLALEAPGTYHHSIIVGNLAEQAAKAVGGNPLLARAGTYYHDIGKMEIPEYFIENQLSLKSKHDELTPSMSAVVLAAHVKKGRALGESADIPDDVLNFVEEHHGTMVMSFFYNKALEESGDDVAIDDYRYPGPKPRTRETGIVMLADGVEAASRTLEEPSPARINSLIQRVVDARVKSGELDECPLTLKDLARIREAFAKVLVGAFHRRIVYPTGEEAGSDRV